MAIATFHLTLLRSEKISPHVLSMTFNREGVDQFDYIPGQFITFLLPSENGVKRRSYSIANIQPRGAEVEVVLTYIKGGLASELFFNMQPGDQVEAQGPVGRLIMRDECCKRYILVGTSTGIAPYRAMLDDLATRSQHQDFKAVIVQGVQYRQDLLFGQDFVHYAQTHDHIDFHACFSRDDLSNPLPYEHAGYVQNLFEVLDLNPTEDAVYLCGNPKMIDESFATLKEMGFEVSKIRREKYISST